MPNKILLEAIALRKCVRVTYNRVQMTLAPHILYTRHGDLFIDGVVLEKGGNLPREIKLGVFKVIGLNDVTIMDQPFDPWEGFEPAAEKYEGVTLFAVDLA